MSKCDALQNTVQNTYTICHSFLHVVYSNHRITENRKEQMDRVFVETASISFSTMHVVTLHTHKHTCVIQHASSV